MTTDGILTQVPGLILSRHFIQLLDGSTQLQQSRYPSQENTQALQYTTALLAHPGVPYDKPQSGLEKILIKIQNYCSDFTQAAQIEVLLADPVKHIPGNQVEYIEAAQKLAEYDLLDFLVHAVVVSFPVVTYKVVYVTLLNAQDKHSVEQIKRQLTFILDYLPVTVPKARALIQHILEGGTLTTWDYRETLDVLVLEWAREPTSYLSLLPLDLPRYVISPYLTRHWN